MNALTYKHLKGARAGDLGLLCGVGTTRQLGQLAEGCRHIAVAGVLQLVFDVPQAQDWYARSPEDMP